MMATQFNINKNLKDIIEQYLKYWYVFLIAVVLSFAGIYIYLLSITPSYKVSSTLFIQEDKNGESSLKGTAFSDLNVFQTSKTVVNEMEILRSRDLLYKVFEELFLGVAYFKKGEFRDFELYGEELPIKITTHYLNKNAYLKDDFSITVLSDRSYRLKDGKNSKILNFGDKIKNKNYNIIVDKGPAFKVSSDPVKIKFKDILKVSEAYSLGLLKITPVAKDANTLVLSISDNLPKRGIDILTKLIEIYNQQNVNHKNITAINTINFIDERLKFLESDLSKVESNVETYKQENMVADMSMDAQMNVTKSGEYNQLLSESDIQLGRIRSLENYFNENSVNQNNLVPSTLGINDHTLDGLVAKYNEIQLEKNRMLRTANPDNPLVQNLNEQLIRLKANIKENLSIIKKGNNIDRNNLLANASRFSSKIRSTPAIERGLLERSREQSVKANSYRYLLQKREEASLSLSTTIPTAQIVAKPAFDSIPVSPKKDIFYLGALLIGVGLPFGIIFLKNKLNTKVKDSADIELLTGVRILGELSHNGVKDNLIARNNRRSTISELFRYIRINLGFMTTDHPNKVIMVTSSTKGEGKTFFSINLGTTLSTLDKKVVILEFDLRKPDLLHKIGLKQNLGITDYMSSEDVFLDDIIRPSTLSPNLFVIGCGRIPENPSEILMDTQNYRLFEELKERFDYVIVDTSPVGLVADAFSLAGLADVSIYIVRYNYTDKYHLNILQDIYENKKLKNPMVVFNDAKRNEKHKYGYGSMEYATETA
jgi:tyrosine-protein kinase Etk/Wzc